MKVRMPAELKEQIEQAAKAAGRSMNAEIVARLQRSLEGDHLGFKGDAIDAVGMQAFIVMMLHRTLEKTDLSPTDRELFDRLYQMSRHVIENTYFSKDGKNTVGVLKHAGHD